MLSLLVGTVWSFGMLRFSLFFLSPSAVRKSSFFYCELLTTKKIQILIKSEGGSNETVARL